jgi:hypothetical protein
MPVKRNRATVSEINSLAVGERIGPFDLSSIEPTLLGFFVMRTSLASTAWVALETLSLDQTSPLEST